MNIGRYTYHILIIVIIIVTLFIVTLNEELSIKLGFISIEIALISIIIALKSDETVNSIANAEFRRIIGQIEDLRLELKEAHYIVDLPTLNIMLEPKIISKNQINTWKCQTYTDDAIDILLKSNIKPNSVSRFLNLINNYVQQILPARNILCIEAVINIMSIYNRIYSLENIVSQKTLEGYEFESRKTDSKQLIRSLTGIGNNISIDLNFVEIYKSLLVNFTEQDSDIIRWEILFARANDIINLQYNVLTASD